MTTTAEMFDLAVFNDDVSLISSGMDTLRTTEVYNFEFVIARLEKSLKRAERYHDFIEFQLHKSPEYLAWKDAESALMESEDFQRYGEAKRDLEEAKKDFEEAQSEFEAQQKEHQLLQEQHQNSIKETMNKIETRTTLPPLIIKRSTLPPVANISAPATPQPKAYHPTSSQPATPDIRPLDMSELCLSATEGARNRAEASQRPPSTPPSAIHYKPSPANQRPKRNSSPNNMYKDLVNMVLTPMTEPPSDEEDSSVESSTSYHSRSCCAASIDFAPMIPTAEMVAMTNESIEATETLVEVQINEYEKINIEPKLDVESLFNEPGVRELAATVERRITKQERTGRSLEPPSNRGDMNKDRQTRSLDPTNAGIDWSEQRRKFIMDRVQAHVDSASDCDSESTQCWNEEGQKEGNRAGASQAEEIQLTIDRIQSRITVREGYESSSDCSTTSSQNSEYEFADGDGAEDGSCSSVTHSDDESHSSQSFSSGTSEYTGESEEFNHLEIDDRMGQPKNIQDHIWNLELKLASSMESFKGKFA